MVEDNGSARQGHRLLQVGSLLILLALLVGLAIPRLTVPRLGLSTHLLGIMQGTFLMVLGLVWPKLALSRSAARVGVGLAIYGCIAAWVANLLAAIWGAGSSMLPLAAGSARGSGVQEAVIRVLLVSAAVSLVSATALLVWGLRVMGAKSPRN
ncbi:MAG TPA: hydrogenase [Vicinamibacteria bacterium]|nr:hydrogenase [Vicinamibacteria bacterium]